MNINIELTSGEHKDLLSYCKLNNFEPETILKSSYLEGFRIEKYGLLGNTSGVQEKQVVKEIIVEKRVEIPVETIKEVVKIEYVEVPIEVVKYVETPVEIIKEIEVIQYVDREVIKEVPVEIIKEKIVNVIQEVPVPNMDKIWDETQVNELLSKIQQLENRPPEIIETIKEVMVEKDDSKLKPKLDALQNTVQKLKLDNIEKDRLIKEYEKTIQDIQKFNEGTKAMYLKGSNLDNKL